MDICPNFSSLALRHHDPKVSRQFYDAILQNEVVTARKLLDEGLDPNCIVFPADDGLTHGGGEVHTLLYAALVKGRMGIVQMLLAEGANPDTPIASRSIPRISPFSHVIKQKNMELFKLLLRDSKHDVKPQVQNQFAPDSRLQYGMFRQYHDDDEVLKAIMEARPLYSPPSGDYIPSANPKLPNLMYAAASCHDRETSERLGRYLISFFGVERVVDDLLIEAVYTEHPCDSSDAHVRDTLAFVMELHGVEKFVGNTILRCSLIARSPSFVLELMMGRLYERHGGDKQCWRMVMTTMPSPETSQPFFTDEISPPYISYMHGCLVDIFESREKSRFEVLLEWGMYSVVRDIPQQTLFFTLVESMRIREARKLVDLYPYCLQEQWVVAKQNPWSRDARIGKHESNAYLASIMEERKQAPLLQQVCRSAIYEALGVVNPAVREQRLKPMLADDLLNFVQCKGVLSSWPKSMYSKLSGAA